MFRRFRLAELLADPFEIELELRHGAEIEFSESEAGALLGPAAGLVWGEATHAVAMLLVLDLAKDGHATIPAPMLRKLSGAAGARGDMHGPSGRRPTATGAALAVVAAAIAGFGSSRATAPADAVFTLAHRGGDFLVTRASPS